MTANRDLEGLLVVSVEQAVAAPYASSRLADAGARVIKVERPEGDFARRYDEYVNGESTYFVWLNRGKESVCLDLKDAVDRRLLGRMIAQADVFIQNLAPGAIDRLGFTAQALRADNRRLITCAISGYGDEGPYRDLKAYDLLVQAESGLSSITGNEAGMVRVGVSICDIGAGNAAVAGILQALYARERTGQGRHVAVSLFHVMADWMNVPYMQFAYSGYEPARIGLHHATLAPYGDYVCGDGKSVLFSIQNEQEWERLCRDVLNRPEIAADSRFVTLVQRTTNRRALDVIIDEVFRAATRDEIVARLEAARIAYGRISTLEDLKNHPQNRRVEVATPSGPVRMLAPGAIVDGVVPTLGAVPALGEHSVAIRAEFG